MARKAALTATLLLCLAAGCARPPHPPAQGRNVVLVVIDTLRQDHLAAYGYSRDTAPCLGELARQGAVFQGLTPAPWTKPATASLLTGLHPLHHPAIDRVDRLPDAAETLAGRLRRAGYHTLGASANGWVSPTFGFGRGFDSFLYRHNAKAALPAGRLGWAGPGSTGPCVEMGKVQESDPPLLAGWYTPDATGRWSAPSSSLVLGAPPGPGPRDLWIEGDNFRLGPVGVTLRVNGRPALRTELPAGPFRVAGRLPEEPPDPSLVEIATDFAFVPARQGLLDDRTLGLYLTRVCLERTGGP